MLPALSPVKAKLPALSPLNAKLPAVSELLLKELLLLLLLFKLAFLPEPIEKCPNDKPKPILCPSINYDIQLSLI